MKATYQSIKRKMEMDHRIEQIAVTLGGKHDSVTLESIRQTNITDMLVNVFVHGPNFEACNTNQ